MATLEISNPVTCCNESVTTDNVFSDTPGLFTGGIKASQSFVWRKSFVADEYGVITNK
jgi:hypothetical protein